MVRCSIYFRASQHLNLVTTNLGDVVRLLTVGVRFGQNFENWGLRGYMEKKSGFRLLDADGVNSSLCMTDLAIMSVIHSCFMFCIILNLRLAQVK